MSHFKDQLIAIFDYSIIFNAFNDTFPDLLRHLCIYFEFWQHQSFTCRKLNLVGLRKSFKTPKKLNVFRVNLSTACNSLSHISSIYHLMKDDIKTSFGEGGEATEEGEMRESREPAIIFIIIIIIIWCHFSCDHSWMSLFSFVSPSCFSILLPFFLSLLVSLLLFRRRLISSTFSSLSFSLPSGAGVLCNPKTTVSLSLLVVLTTNPPNTSSFPHY